MKKLALFRTATLLAVSVTAAPVLTYGQAISIGIAIHTPPPALPVYTQPPCPTPGFLWTPGYWGYAGSGYYWVPGVWVAPPQPGLLWTPGYWAWRVARMAGMRVSGGHMWASTAG